MKSDHNTLCPITPSSSGFGQWELSPVPHNHSYRHLPRAGYSFRPDLDGLIQNQNGRPVVQCGDEEIAVVNNPTAEVNCAWSAVCV